MHGKIQGFRNGVDYNREISQDHSAGTGNEYRS